jgi:hypothetical protein
MKRILLILIVAGMALIGCGGGLKDKLVGTWKFDSSTFAMEGITPEQKAEAAKFLDAPRLELKADGTYVGTGMGNDDKGKWSLDGKDLKVKPDKENDTKTSMTVSDDGAKIHWVGPGPGGKTMTIDMVKA